MASKRTNNARLGFAQGAVNSKYFYHVFFQLSHYCSSFPAVRIRNYKGKENIGLEFFTRTLPCFTELHSLFYPNPSRGSPTGNPHGKRIKVVPENIYDILTPVALAHLIMGDGSAGASALLICTDSYTISDTVRLMNVLIIRYELDCSLRFLTPTQCRIHIKQNSIPKLRTIVGSFMCESMKYKLVGGKAGYSIYDTNYLNDILITGKRLNILNAKAEYKAKRLEHLTRLHAQISHKVEIIDTLKQETKLYHSMSEAARALGCGKSTISLAIKNLKEKGVSNLINKRYQVKPFNEGSLHK